MIFKLIKFNLIIFLLSSFFTFSKASESLVVGGGCFWCIEADFEKLAGVESVESGYASDQDASKPSYKAVASGKTVYKEVVKVTFNPTKVSLDEVLYYYWSHVDPTDSGGMFVDRGDQYTSVIYYQNQKQKKTAMNSKKRLARSNIFKDKIFTPILKLKNYYPAENYHQDYYKKSPLRYNAYRRGSGRDKFLKKYWNAEAKKKWLKTSLTDLQYKVTQEEGTEPPFKNKYWNNKRAGIYVDLISGEPLFSSTHKYKSGTGWPSFFETINKDDVELKVDNKWGMSRTEVRSKKGDSHLGHLFNDGPKPTGLRYCINSASLKFIPKEKLKGSKYEEFLSLFK